jgi:hypothetical protein
MIQGDRAAHTYQQENKQGAEGKVSPESRKSFIDRAHFRDRFDKYRDPQLPEEG